MNDSNNLPPGRQNYQQSKEPYKAGVEERKGVHGGTQPIVVPKIQQSQQLQSRPPAASMKRKNVAESSSSKNAVFKLAATSIAEQMDVPLASVAISDAASVLAANVTQEGLVSSSLISSMHLQGDYTMLSSQMKQKSRQQNPIVIKTKASGLSHAAQTGVPSGASTNSINNSKIKLRIAQQKTRSSSSISNTQKHNLNITQKGPNPQTGFSAAANESLKSGTHLKMAQLLQQQKGVVTRMTSIKTQSAKSRQNQYPDFNGLPTDINNQQQQAAEFLINAKQGNEKESTKLSKSFQCTTTTAASKKQRQTLKGMIEGLNQTQNASIPNSSSKRKSNHSHYVANSMHIQKQRQAVLASSIGAAVVMATQPLQETLSTSLGTTKNKDKLFTSYNYQPPSSVANTQPSVTGAAAHQHNGSKSSSSLTQLPGKHRQNLNSSLLMFNSTSKKIGQQIVGPKMHQITRVDFEKLNKRQSTESSSKVKIEKVKVEKTATSSELMMESYQDIVKSGEQTCMLNLSQKGLTLSTQKAFLSNSNRLNLPKRTTTKSIEDSSSGQFTTQTASSGPLNPFLEQILREIPNAYSVNASGQNSAGTTGLINIEAFNNHEIHVNLHDRGGIVQVSESKKTLGKILKNFQSKINISSTHKDHISNTFNLTSTAAALRAASDKNAADFQCPIETMKTFETGASQSNSNNVSWTEQPSGKKYATQSVVNSKVDKEKKAQKNQRFNESRGQIRLTSQKRSSKSSYSGSQKRQKDGLANKQQTNKDQQAIYISEQTSQDVKKKEHENSRQNLRNKTHLSQTRLPNQAMANTQNRYGSLVNVVKVAAKQKVSKISNAPGASGQNSGGGGSAPLKQQQQPSTRQKQQQYSLNTTQVLEEQLLQLKLNSNQGKNNQLTIPQKTTKAQSKSRGQLITSTGNMQTVKQIVKKGSSPATNDRTSKDGSFSLGHTQTQPQPQPHGQYSNEAKHRYQKQQLQNSKQRKMPVKLPQYKQYDGGLSTKGWNISAAKTNGKTNEPQKLKSNQLKFDWSGFLSNLMHENFQPKKSISGPGNVNGSTLCERPYQLQQDIQNKTQPLPKGLLQKTSHHHQHDAYDLKNHNAIMPQATKGAYGAPHLQKTESRGSEYRPRIGRKQIEIAPLSGAQTNFAATMNQNQLRNAKESAMQVINVLTEVTDPGDNTEKYSPTSMPSTHRTPGKVNEDYKFGKLLGEGAYAEVRLAYKKSEGKNYAAKIYDKAKLVDDHRRNSVCREVMLMQKLKHAFVVQFSEAFETDHHVYLIIEYVTGKSLHDYLKRQRASPTSKTEFDQTLSEEEAKRVIRQLLQCLEYLHSEGISHRDIKLENILLDQDQNVKVIDFGFSTCYQPQKKQRMFCGTPSYMAPEIVSRVEYYGPPADLWACGVLLFCLLNGFFPFKGQTDAELYRKINRGAFKMIRSDLSDDCLNMLKEMFNVNPDSRMSCVELLQENWFLTDMSKKRSIAEIRREFKAKILKKFPVRSVNKNTICIPAPKINNIVTVTSAEPPITNADEEEKTGQDAQNNLGCGGGTNERGVLINNSLQFYRRDFNHASPPSMMPSESQQTHPNIVSFTSRTSEMDSNAALHGGGDIEDHEAENDEKINQEALLAYYNTSGAHVQPQASAPPSGKFNLTTPYSAYNQWPVHQQGSPPSMADVPPCQDMNEQPDAFSRPYESELMMQKRNSNVSGGIIDAADVEIIIQHGRGAPLRYASVPEYRDQEEDLANGIIKYFKPSQPATTQMEDNYSAGNNSVPANKQ